MLLSNLFWLAATVGLAIGSYLLARYLLDRFLVAFLRRTRPGWIQPVQRSRLFTWLALLAPLAILNIGLLAILQDLPFASSLATTGLALAIVAVLGLLLNAIVDIALSIYERQEMARRVPLRGLAQLFKVSVFGLLAIIGIAIFFHVPASIMFTSIAATLAAAGFIFRDPILGFIAGIQLAGNNMVAIGDWVQMPKYGADGAVIEISMTTVKVENWDKTVTMIPTYTMVSDSFTNWRNVFDTGGRRIKRAINVDVHTVAPATAEQVELARALGVPVIQAEMGPAPSNFTLYRAYLTAYLRRHPDLLPEQTLIVRQLDHTEDGLPVEIIVFTKKTDFNAFEAVQGEVFDHAFAMLPRFGLRAYQRQRSGNYVAPLEVESS